MAIPINPVYLKREIIPEMTKSFLLQKPSCIVLQDFLKPEVYSELVSSLSCLEGEKIKIPNRYSYTKLSVKNDIKNIFSSRLFLDFLSRMIQQRVLGVYLEIKRFQHRDFTLLHDLGLSARKLEFFFILSSTTSWNSKDSGNKVYCDENGNSFLFCSFPNSLNIINKTREISSFVQYINHKALDRFLIFIEGVLVSKE